MEVGDLVIDSSTGMKGIIIDKHVVFIGDGVVFAAGEITEWDWAILYENGSIEGADSFELKLVCGKE